MRHRFALLLSCGTVLLAAVAVLAPSFAAGPAPASGPAVERARREVRLLDDIYKTAIVLITKHYVNEKSDIPAGEAFKLLFQSMKEKGWHEVRLLDGLGEPINDANKPKDEFEKKAIQEVLAGKAYYEEIATIDGKEYLRAATVVPMVMDKCVMCHENYRGKKVVGALGYTLPLDVKATTP